jgi:DNA replication and repair protein RecF
MHLTELQGANLRCFAEFSLTPVPGVNLLLGENGAGKTSIIEAIHILGYGRSFRGRIRDGLIKQGAAALQITTRWQDGHGGSHQAGLQHSGNEWQARQDGADVDNLGQFCSHFPVLSFEPGSHALISGPAENRRRFLDWALFHVEPEFFSQWRRFNRALKQRNALLKAQPSAETLAAWDHEFAESGEAIHYYRQRYLDALNPVFQNICRDFLPEGGAATLAYAAGWRQPQMSLLDALRLNRDRDLQTGFCNVGPHRADWQATLNGQLQQEHFSRGQAKLLALSALLAQAQKFVAEKGFWPLLCFDDLASELDSGHFRRVLRWLSGSQAQIWISGTEDQPAYTENFSVIQRFHVEHGRIADTQ